MAYTDADVQSAIDKLGAIELTDAEIEAIGDLLASPPEVDGFAQPSVRGWAVLAGLRAGIGAAGVDLGDHSQYPTGVRHDTAKISGLDQKPSGD